MTPERSVCLVALALFSVTAACGENDRDALEVFPTAVEPSATLSIHTGSGDPATLRVAVADTDDERRRGLMGVEELPRDHGMAFIWDEPISTTFWMKNTLVPLSIAFWDADGRIVSILDMAPCEREPCPRYGPGEPIVGAVEANLGWFEERGVSVGDEVQLEVGADV